MLNQNLDKISELINSKISEAHASVLEAEVGDSSIKIEASSIKDVCELLKENDDFSFNSLQVITGTDYSEYIEVSYFLNNIDLENPRQLQIKTQLENRDNPEIESISSVWLAAAWQERECYDMLGVIFKNHKDLRRILCPDDWEGFPLRRDYKAAKFYNGMEIYPKEKMNLEESEFAEKQKARIKEELMAAKAKAKLEAEKEVKDESEVGEKE